MSTEEEDRNIAPPKQTPPAVLFLKVVDAIDMALFWVRYKAPPPLISPEPMLCHFTGSEECKSSGGIALDERPIHPDTIRTQLI